MGSFIESADPAAAPLRLRKWLEGSYHYKVYRCGGCVPAGVPSMRKDVAYILDLVQKEA